MQAIQFFHLQSNRSFKNRTEVKKFLVKLAQKEKAKIQELRIIFCSDKYLLDINRSFLKHDYYTDIITFQLSLPSEPIVGEIYISLDRVAENARTYSTSFTRELHRVIFHGLLHLCGYKDKLKSDQQEMRDLEERYLNLYFSSKH
jgi:probable rRNA maturation factor